MPVIPVKGKSLSELIALANEKNYDFVFIDTEGKDRPSSYEATEQADLCLVPLRDHKKGNYPCVNIEASIKLGKDLIFVLNHCPTHLRRDLAKKANSLGSCASFRSYCRVWCLSVFGHAAIWPVSVV